MASNANAKVNANLTSINTFIFAQYYRLKTIPRRLKDFFLDLFTGWMKVSFILITLLLLGFFLVLQRIITHPASQQHPNYLLTLSWCAIGCLLTHGFLATIDLRNTSDNQVSGSSYDSIYQKIANGFSRNGVLFTILESGTLAAALLIEGIVLCESEWVKGTLHLINNFAHINRMQKLPGGSEIASAALALFALHVFIFAWSSSRHFQYFNPLPLLRVYNTTLINAIAISIVLMTWLFIAYGYIGISSMLCIFLLIFVVASMAFFQAALTEKSLYLKLADRLVSELKFTYRSWQKESDFRIRSTRVKKGFELNARIVKAIIEGYEKKEILSSPQLELHLALIFTQIRWLSRRIDKQIKKYNRNNAHAKAKVKMEKYFALGAVIGMYSIPSSISWQQLPSDVQMRNTLLCHLENLTEGVCEYATRNRHHDGAAFSAVIVGMIIALCVGFTPGCGSTKCFNDRWDKMAKAAIKTLRASQNSSGTDIVHVQYMRQEIILAYSRMKQKNYNQEEIELIHLVKAVINPNNNGKPIDQSEIQRMVSFSNFVIYGMMCSILQSVVQTSFPPNQDFKQWAGTQLKNLQPEEIYLNSNPVDFYGG